MKKSKPKHSKKQIIKAVTAVRERNNILWMHLVEKAMDRPDMQEVLEKICANDKKIRKWMRRASRI